MADQTVSIPEIQGGYKTFRDMGDGSHAEVVAFAAEGSVTLTGDVVVDTFGELNDSAEVDPDAASATIPALLRGVLTQQVAIVAALADPATETTQAAILAAIGDAADEANDPTVIGLLKQVIVKLGDVEAALA